ncbi:MurR/RpiR family transcriptional regulator [Roseovarius aestuarii]|nr:MurR/RpiR family transcriptional regulator [Roseovarius aestuarii]
MDIDEKLTQALPDLPRKLAIAARYALDNPERIALDSMRATAQACGVAAPTMQRLARHLGHDGYDEFRQDFQTLVMGGGFGARVEALRSNFQNASLTKLTQRMAEAAQNNIADAAARLDTQQIEAFVRAVRRGGRTYVVGAGSMHWAAGMIEATGRLTLPDIVSLPAGTVTASERISTIRDCDTLLALAIAPYCVQTVNAMQYARAAGAAVYAITDRPSSPLAPHADGVFLTPAASPHYYPSTIAVQLVAEILLAACAAASGGATRQRLRQLDEIRRASGAYLEE